VLEFSLLRAEGFSCSLDAHCGGLGISKQQFLIKYFLAAHFLQFLVIKTWIRIRIGIEPKMLDPDPESMNPDPKHYFL
jgi:hypothetical protein